MEKEIIENVKEACALVLASAGIGLITKKMFKKSVTNDPSSSFMNLGSWVIVMTASIYVRDYLIKQKIIT